MSAPLTRTSRRRRGFSLMELMVVIAILGILATLVATNVVPILARGRETKAKSDIKAIKEAITSYRTVHNVLPDSLDQLTQPDPKNFNETYIEEGNELSDPWGNPYVYQRESNSKYTIICYGADGIPGGEGEDADIDDKTMNKKEDQ
ncbi:MAG: type II secretion system major pseudopilin GspG [Planctomycetes bacterium]|nr:type II secretion system major pseudopilin GspG [Planctomycetota bacterium]